MLKSLDGIPTTQKNIFHTVQIEDLVPADHPLRRIRPLVDTERIRELCKDLYCPDNGRPSIPPEQMFLAMLGGYLLGVRSDRKLVMELQCNMAFRWFVGLDIDSEVWDSSSFSKNREHRFDKSDILERLFDDTVKQAMDKGWVSTHWSVDGTLVRANASQKSFVPIEVYQKPGQYREAMSGRRRPRGRAGSRTRAIPRWISGARSDPDARIATKSSKETAVPAYTVNGVMDNRNRILMGIGVEIFQGPTSEREGALNLLERAKKRLGLRPKTLGADKGFFEKKFLKRLFKRWVQPHVATMEKGTDKAYTRVRMRERGGGFYLSQRARKKIEELWGESKEGHGFRRFLRRMLENVRQEAWMMGWLLNLKRLAALQARVTA